MNDITPKEAIEILRHYTDLGYGIVIEGEDTSKTKQALSLANKTLAVEHSLLPLVSDLDSAYMRGYEVGKAEGILKAEARPQGEWQGGELGHCTNCGHKGSASDIWNNCTGMFCPNCGAHLTDV